MAQKSQVSGRKWRTQRAPEATDIERRAAPDPCFPRPLLPVTTNLLPRCSPVFPPWGDVLLERWARVTCFIDYYFPIMEQPVCTPGLMFVCCLQDIKDQKDVVPILGKVKLPWVVCHSDWMLESSESLHKAVSGLHHSRIKPEPQGVEWGHCNVSNVPHPVLLGSGVEAWKAGGFNISNDKKEWLQSWLIYGTYVIFSFLLCCLHQADFCLSFVVAKWQPWCHAFHTSPSLHLETKGMAYTNTRAHTHPRTHLSSIFLSTYLPTYYLPIYEWIKPFSEFLEISLITPGPEYGRMPKPQSISGKANKTIVICWDQLMTHLPGAGEVAPYSEPVVRWRVNHKPCWDFARMQWGSKSGWWIVSGRIGWAVLWGQLNPSIPVP